MWKKYKIVTLDSLDGSKYYIVKRRLWRFLPVWVSICWVGTRCPLAFETIREAEDFMTKLEEE